MLLTLEPLLARSPFLVLHVRRNNLVGDALRELSIHSDIDLKKPLKVSPSFYSSKYLPGFPLNGVDETAKVLLLKSWSAAIHDFFHSFYKNLITSICQIIKQNISALQQIRMPVDYLRGYRAFFVHSLGPICSSSTRNKQARARLKLQLDETTQSASRKSLVVQHWRERRKKVEWKASEIVWEAVDLSWLALLVPWNYWIKIFSVLIDYACLCYYLLYSQGLAQWLVPSRYSINV